MKEGEGEMETDVQRTKDTAATAAAWTVYRVFSMQKGTGAGNVKGI